MTGWTARPNRFFLFGTQVAPARPERPAGRDKDKPCAMNFAGADVPANAEALAGRELCRRAAKLGRTILVPHILVGAVLGVAAYALLREVQLHRICMHILYATGAASFAPCFFGARWLGRRASDAAVRLKTCGSCDELVARHHLPAGALDDYATLRW